MNLVRLFGTFCLVLIFLNPLLFARMYFSNKSSNIVLMDVSATINLNEAPVKGWNEFSIIRDYSSSVGTGELHYASAEYELIESNSGAIVSNLSQIVSNSGAVLANVDNITSNSGAILANVDNITSNSGAILANVDNITSNSGAILVNVDNIASSSEAIITHESEIDDCVASILTNASDISTNQANIAGIGMFGRGSISFDSNQTMTIDFLLSNDNKLNITDDVTLNESGNRHIINFANGDENILVISANKTLILKNVTLRNFSPKSVQLGAGAQIKFDDGTIIEVTDNEILDGTYTMSFYGNTKLNCFGNELDLSLTDSAIDVLASATLSIQNAKLVGLGGLSSLAENNLKCSCHDATLTLSNCDLILSSHYSFTEGHLNLYQDTNIVGTNVFAYQSPRPLTIKSKAALKVGLNCTFSYDSGITGDAGSAGNDRLVMDDVTSKLFLDGCTLRVTKTGMQLTKGTLVVKDKCTLYSEAGIAEEAVVFGNNAEADDLTVEVLAGGVLDLTNGFLKYNNVGG